MVVGVWSLQMSCGSILGPHMYDHSPHLLFNRSQKYNLAVESIWHQNPLHDHTKVGETFGSRFDHG